MNDLGKTRFCLGLGLEHFVDDIWSTNLITPRRCCDA